MNGYESHQRQLRGVALMNLISGSICLISTPEIEDKMSSVEKEQEVGKDESSKTLYQRMFSTNFMDGKNTVQPPSRVLRI